jgi:hypothetical protein
MRDGEFGGGQEIIPCWHGFATGKDPSPAILPRREWEFVGGQARNSLISNAGMLLCRSSNSWQVLSGHTEAFIPFFCTMLIKRLQFML